MAIPCLPSPLSRKITQFLAYGRPEEVHGARDVDVCVPVEDVLVRADRLLVLDGDQMRAHVAEEESGGDEKRSVVQRKEYVGVFLL